MRYTPLFSLFAIPLASCQKYTPQQIDLLIENAQIYVSTTEILDSIAITNGKIVAIEPGAQITETINLHGAVVVPGFHDSHTHLLAGSFVFDKLLLVGVASFGNIKNKLADYVADAPDVPWVVGYGWIADSLENPDGRELDAVSGEYPVILFDSAGHTILVNSKAMELANIDKNTPDPTGGTIARDENGDPTGLLQESAIELISPLMVSQFTPAQLSANIPTTVADFHKGGVTSVSEILAVPGVNLSFPELYTQYEDLQLRVHYYIPLFSVEDTETIETYLDDVHPWVRFAGAKIWVDGSTGSGEAWSLEESVIEEDHFGTHYFEEEDLVAFIRHAEEFHYTLKFHVNGDAAVQKTLNALETVENELGALHQHYIFDHVVLIAPADYGRMYRLGITASIQPSHALVGQYSDQADHWGELTDSAWGFKKLEDEGIPLVLGTDWPVWPTPNAIVNFWTATQNNGERNLSTPIAFQGYTSLGQQLLGTNAGSLQVGQWADFVVLSDAPFGGTPGSDITIEQTWVGGIRVY